MSVMSESKTMGLRDRDVPGRLGTASDIEVVSSRWRFTLHIERDAAGKIIEAAVVGIDDQPDERKAAFLATMQKALERDQMMRPADGKSDAPHPGGASPVRPALGAHAHPSDSDASLRAELKRLGRSVMSREKRRQFLHVQKTFKQHGPVSLAVLNVRSAACFGRTVGADGTPGTGEVVGRACPRMVMRRGKPRCGACGCPSTPLSDLREVIKSPGWGCGEEKMGKYAAMVPMQETRP